MISGLTTASAGMTVNERAQQLLANNLANMDTPGFTVSQPELIEAPTQSLYRGGYDGDGATYIGKVGAGVTFQEGVPSFAAGTYSNTGRSLDVSIADTTPAGNYASVQAANGSASAQGQVSVGNAGRLGVNGQPLTVFDTNGQPVTGVYAVRNPQYQGSVWISAASAPDYDAAGNPSFVFENAAGQVVATPGTDAAQGLSVRVGTDDDMGLHSFYAVDYQGASGATGIALTKDGALQLNANNQLVDAAGNAILPVGPNGQLIPGGRITVNPNYTGTSLFGSNGQALQDANGQMSFTVTDGNGNVVAGGRLGTVDADVTNLSPLGQTEWMVGNSLNQGTVLPQLQAGTGQLLPGELEGSNVDPTTTMTQMINVMNLYEANQRVVQTEDSLLNTAANDIGKVNA
ncbi:flagellar basal body rod C-terminal domain-containing protein [Alicyclobacillus fodiniaquatilis]|uniref:Flagellar basal body rod C-terminal domain-containing protein n=1 Tax=Alicyclobacillus fodiniaquatilis TaxID=1661150 RepID=A0ABW4JHJ3_9BACL